MSEDEKYLATYKFYDKRGRRLAIFATVEKAYPYVDSEDVELHVYVITCGEKDRFSKKKARLIYEGRRKKTHIFYDGETTISIEDPKRTKIAFIKWCEDNYYKLVDATFQFDAKVFMKGRDTDIEFLSEYIPVGQPKPIEKEEWLKEEVKHGV